MTATRSSRGRCCTAGTVLAGRVVSWPLCSSLMTRASACRRISDQSNWWAQAWQASNRRARSTGASASASASRSCAVSRRPTSSRSSLSGTSQPGLAGSDRVAETGDVAGDGRYAVAGGVDHRLSPTLGVGRADVDARHGASSAALASSSTNPWKFTRCARPSRAASSSSASRSGPFPMMSSCSRGTPCAARRPRGSRGRPACAAPAGRAPRPGRGPWPQGCRRRGGGRSAPLASRPTGPVQPSWRAHLVDASTARPRRRDVGGRRSGIRTPLEPPPERRDGRREVGRELVLVDVVDHQHHGSTRRRNSGAKDGMPHDGSITRRPGAAGRSSRSAVWR